MLSLVHNIDTDVNADTDAGLEMNPIPASTLIKGCRLHQGGVFDVDALLSVSVNIVIQPLVSRLLFIFECVGHVDVACLPSIMCVKSVQCFRGIRDVDLHGWPDLEKRTFTSR